MDAAWGKIVYNPQRKAWCVKGKWQGKYRYFSAYQTALGQRTCQTKQEARQLQLIISNEIANGTFNPLRYHRSRPLHLKKYSQQWLEDIKDNISLGTWHGYEVAIRLYIQPVLGDRFLPDIGHADLKRLMVAMSELSTSTKKNVFGCLHKMMLDAMKDGHITQLPPWIEFKGKNRLVPPQVKYLDVEAQQTIVDKIPERHRPIFLFMMATGCRPSEARALRKQDVFEDHILFVKAFGYKGELKDVKQKEAQAFPIYPELRDILAMAPRSLAPWVFVNPDTGRHYSKDINRIWNKACDDAGVRRIRLYQAVRHSFACQLLNAGVDKLTLSRLLRHSGLKTIDRYAKYEIATLKEVAGTIKRLPGCKQVINERT